MGSSAALPVPGGGGASEKAGNEVVKVRRCPAAGVNRVKHVRSAMGVVNLVVGVVVVMGVDDDDDVEAAAVYRLRVLEMPIAPPPGGSSRTGRLRLQLRWTYRQARRLFIIMYYFNYYPRKKTRKSARNENLVWRKI